MKKYSFMTILAALLVGLSATQANAATFTDVPPTHWAAKEISYLSDRGIIKGGSNGKYNKDASVTKAQAAAILVRAKKLPLTNVPNPKFSDVPTSHPFYKEIAAAVNAGWFSKGTSFQPDNQLKRVEMAKITQLAFGIKGSVPVQWEDMNTSYSGNTYITPLLASGITSGYTSTTFNPSAKVTRAQFAVFVARAMNANFRLKVVNYPKRAAEDIYYPQFADTTNQHEFSYLNSYFREAGADLVAERNEIMELAQEDDYLGEYYEFVVDYTVPRADLHYISVLFESYQYTGGAHGYEQLFADNYDVKSDSFISLDDLATQYYYEDNVIDRINAQAYAMQNRGQLTFWDGLYSLDEHQYQFYMKLGGFVMFFNPYEYGPYSDSIRQFTMPYSLIR
ncbi:S-layer homology domain-containing protein [Domibacillus sp.]|uniref:S-layer homology domain-containing protein n=1 Tax=Domibacillus sp. TaxID=1969783 RepID=UPI002810E9F3|nr:S-layer homology domain-containing protein [Domibacillus sp.]